ncbi:hypothetical protein [Methylopila sp. 73B]|uniref:hypothetical protein n=1 Tax=Methylopila sp. 73B TaxID=1120792 RepID=UPI00036CC780|nr:hypothetical protein [Methylopila sp. 73B]
MPRQLKLGAFMRPVSLHTGAWRYPGAWPDANFNFRHLKRMALAAGVAQVDGEWRRAPRSSSLLWMARRRRRPGKAGADCDRTI